MEVVLEDMVASMEVMEEVTDIIMGNEMLLLSLYMVMVVMQVNQDMLIMARRSHTLTQDTTMEAIRTKEEPEDKLVMEEVKGLKSRTEDMVGVRVVEAMEKLVSFKEGDTQLMDMAVIKDMEVIKDTAGMEDMADTAIMVRNLLE